MQDQPIRQRRPRVIKDSGPIEPRPITEWQPPDEHERPRVVAYSRLGDLGARRRPGKKRQ